MAADHTQEGSPHRRVATLPFVFASSALHLVAAVALWMAAPRTPLEQVPAVVLDVDATYLVPAQGASQRATPVEVTPQEVVEKLRSVAPKPAPRARVRRPKEAVPPPPPPPARAPAADRLVLSMRAQTRKLDLNLPPQDYTPPPRRKRRTRPPGPSTAERNWLIKTRLDRALAQDASARTVSTGRAHASLYDLLRDAHKSFFPSWAMVDGDARGRGTMSDTGKTILRSLGKSWLKNVKRYMEAGLPGDREGKDPAMLAGYASIIRMAEQDAGGLQCVLCVTLDHKRQPRILLLRGSGKKVFDAEALKALRRASRIRSLPSDAPSATACYRFSAKYYRVPPLPTILCTFDESVPTISCVYPGKRIMKKGVVLESVKILGEQG